MLSKKCKEHMASVDMSCMQHFKFAFGILVELKKAELALLVHMVAPRYFETYASNKIKELANKLEAR